MLPLAYPELLPEYDAVMHLDGGLILTRPPSELWAEFSRFSDKTLLSLHAWNAVKLKRSSSKKFDSSAKFQTGVMLMNLTRMRTIGFTTRVKMISIFSREQLKLAEVSVRTKLVCVSLII